jgi:signal transduction histidine kinase/phage shock protein PspC (stress-responsive transcriptional regulator)
MPPDRRTGHDGGTMTTSVPLSPTTPRLYRAVHGRMLGGVASGIAEHLGISRRWVRVAFVVLSFSAGLGVLLYGAFWIVLRTPPEAEPESPRRAAIQYVVAAVAAGITLIVNAHTLPLGWWFLPSVLACFGGALLWREASETERDRWRRLSRNSLTAGATDRLGILRVVAGVTLVVAGAVFILAKAGISAVGVGLAAMLVTVGGIALITGPWWLKLVRDLSDERRERIRSEERADIAAHLHDSVLQTLALIQRNATQPREVARLARSQERELRSKLYGAGVPNGQFGAALHAAAAEIEDTYAITVDVVVVGDQALNTRLDAMVAATREAMVNAAKHAQVTTVSLYAEVSADDVWVFVRDRGVGFELDAIDDDRQGVRGSIIGRLERHHGTATIKSKPGDGTEVALRMDIA